MTDLTIAKAPTGSWMDTAEGWLAAHGLEWRWAYRDRDGDWSVRVWFGAADPFDEWGDIRATGVEYDESDFPELDEFESWEPDSDPCARKSFAMTRIRRCIVEFNRHG